MKTSTVFTLPAGRVVGQELVPLYLRVVTEDGQLAKVTLGIEQKGGAISWQLSVVPEALTWGANCVEDALVAAKMNVNAQANSLDGEGRAT